MLFGIRLEGWLTIAAIIAGPVIAFAVQNWRDKSREGRNRKTEIFRRLLLTLKVPMAPTHVDAINSIPLEFSSEKKVLDAWKLYSSHLNVPQSPQQTNEQVARWAEKKFDLLIDLVYEVGQGLGGYDHLNKASLRDSIYVPKGYAESEEEMRQIRAQWLQVLKGERVLPMTILGPVQVERPLELLPQIPAPQAQAPVRPQQSLPAQGAGEAAGNRE